MKKTEQKINPDQLIADKEAQLLGDGYISFSESELKQIDLSSAEKIKTHFSGRGMIALPDKEIQFFEWLKKNDPPIWNDLWPEDESDYLVGIDFLHLLIGKNNGFPICDLVDENNYWFTTGHIKPLGHIKLAEVDEKLSKGKALSFQEALLVEVARGAIDIWHFCYRYHVPVSIAKQKVEIMHHNDILVHLTDREDLLKYMDI